MSIFKLGKFLLLKKVNVGGMAEIYLAKVFGFGGMERLLALKRILPKVAAESEFIRMFIAEAKLSVLFNHPNIAHTHELGRIGQTYYIALEFVDGKDLRATYDRVRSLGQPLPLPLACAVVAQVCDGLDHAHSMLDPSGAPLHLVHRDVSPQNIIVGYDGQVKLIDFGVAKASIQNSNTRTGVLKGKLGYMPPEQVLGQPYDHRGDIFAAGVVLWELLTSQRLFKTGSEYHVLERIRQCELYPPSVVNPAVPRELEPVLLRALTREPARRYQTAGDFHDALMTYLVKRGELITPLQVGDYFKRIFAAEYAEERVFLDEARRVPPNPPGLQVLEEEEPEPVYPSAAPRTAAPPDPPAGAEPSDTSDVVRTVVSPPPVAPEAEAPSEERTQADARPPAGPDEAGGEDAGADEEWPDEPIPDDRPGLAPPAPRAASARAAAGGPDAPGAAAESSYTIEEVLAGGVEFGVTSAPARSRAAAFYAAPLARPERFSRVQRIALVASALVLLLILALWLTGRGGGGQLVVISTPAGVSFTIDGKPTGCATPCTVSASPGERVLRFAFPGRPQVRTVTLRAGQSLEVRVSATP